MTRIEYLFKCCCIPLPLTSLSKLGSVQIMSEEGLPNLKADPLPDCLHKVHFFPYPLLFFFLLLKFVWLFVFLFFNRIWLMSSGFSNLHLEFVHFLPSPLPILASYRKHFLIHLKKQGIKMHEETEIGNSNITENISNIMQFLINLYCMLLLKRCSEKQYSLSA